MFRFFRHYAIASLVCVLVCAVVLTYLYRTVSTQSIIRTAERANLALGYAVMNGVRGHLIEFLDTVNELGPEQMNKRRLPAQLATAISELMHDTSVVRVKIYNRRGIVAFSTKTAQIGRDQADNPGFVSAIGGKYATTLIYRDAFNAFDRVTEEDNLLQTYIPVRASATDPIEGVFEIYTNVDPLVAQNQRALFTVLGSVALVLAWLYGALLLVVRRATRVIDAQQQTIRERTATLEVLSAHMIRSEESQRQRLALELHEGLAQTLSAAKLSVESAARRIDSDDAQESVMSVVPVLQSAIDKTRTIATALRPSSVDELGLLPTISWFCREFGRQHPDMQIEPMLEVEERRVAAPLKIVIFRIIEASMRTIAGNGSADRVELALTGVDDTIRLEITRAGAPSAAIHDTATDSQGLFADVGERTIQSGGSFSASRTASGGLTLCASWQC